MTIIRRHIGAGLSYYQFQKDNIASHRFYWTKGDSFGRLDALRMARAFRKMILDSKKWSLKTWKDTQRFRCRQILRQMRAPHIDVLPQSCTLDFDLYL